MLMGSACSDDTQRMRSPLRAVEGRPRPLYVAIGASETFGIGAADPLREAWPRVFHRTALPRRSRFVNLGVPGATVADALRQEARRAAKLKPEVVTVWLNVNDILTGVGVRAFERDLNKLLRLVSTDEDTKILIANTPPLRWLPAYRACSPNPPSAASDCPVWFKFPRPKVVDRMIESYNAAIDRAAARVGASVVDLHAATLVFTRGGGGENLVAADGFHPSTQGHREIARAFASAFADFRR
jgi:acyl-CoA thioesterase I